MAASSFRLARSSLRSLLRPPLAAAGLRRARAAGAMGSPDAVVSGGGPTGAGSPNPAASRRAAAVCADPRRGSPRASLRLPARMRVPQISAVVTNSAMPAPANTNGVANSAAPPTAPAASTPTAPTSDVATAFATDCDGERRGARSSRGVSRGTPHPRTRPTTPGTLHAAVLVHPSAFRHGDDGREGMRGEVFIGPRAIVGGGGDEDAHSRGDRTFRAPWRVASTRGASWRTTRSRASRRGGRCRASRCERACSRPGGAGPFRGSIVSICERLRVLTAPRLRER